MCYMWSEIWGRRDYLGSKISGISLSKPFSLYQLCFQNWTADYLGSLESWSDYLGDYLVLPRIVSTTLPFVISLANSLRSGYIRAFCKLGVQVYFNFLLKIKTGNGLSFSAILGNAKMTDLKIILYLDGMLEDLSDGDAV